MPKKKEQKPLEELTREELIEKCYNQRNLIKQLQEGGKQLLKEFIFLKDMLSEKNLPHKLRIATEETLSYMDEVEKMKQEIKKLQGDN